MRLKHKDASQAAHPVDVGQAARELRCLRHRSWYSVSIIVDLWRDFLSLRKLWSCFHLESALSSSGSRALTPKGFAADNYAGVHAGRGKPRPYKRRVSASRGLGPEAGAVSHAGR